MKKKLIGIFLSVVMIASMVTGCGSADTGAGQEGSAGTEESSTAEQEESADSESGEEEDAEEESAGDDRLVIPVSATVTNLNPLLESMARSSYHLLQMSCIMWIRTR